MHLCSCTLWLALFISIGEVYSAEIYVCPTSNPRDSHPGEPCFTLDQIADNNITSNSVFKLLPGQHTLTRPFIAQDVDNITFEGVVNSRNGEYPVIEFEVSNENFSSPVLFHHIRKLRIFGLKFSIPSRSNWGWCCSSRRKEYLYRIHRYLWSKKILLH